MKKGLIIPDVHAPYHDKRAWKLLLEVLSANSFDYVVILGDFIDNYAVTAHPKAYMRKLNWAEEIEAANALLDEVAVRAKKAKVVFCEGNHENRWPRYLAERCPEDNRPGNNMKDIFKIRIRGWEWVPYNSTYQIGKMHFTHAAGKNCGKTAAHGAAALYQTNVAFGHTHRMIVAYEGNAVGSTHVAATLGWLGDRTKLDYLHKVEAMRSSTLGFGVFYVMPGTSDVHLQAVPIVHYKCVVEGKVYAA